MVSISHCGCDDPGSIPGLDRVLCCYSLFITGKSKRRLFYFRREQNFKPDRPRRTSTKIAISLFPECFSNCLVYMQGKPTRSFFQRLLNFFQSYRFPHMYRLKMSNASAIFVRFSLPPKSKKSRFRFTSLT